MSSTEIHGAAVTGSTNLKRTIGLPGALGISFHQIVGGGVIALTGTAIAITGGGTPLAYVLATVLVMLVTVPVAALGAAMPATGGAYTYASRLIHPGAGFANMWLWTLGNLSLSIYGLAAGEYLNSLFPALNSTVVAISMLVFFYLVNLFGAALSARLGVILAVVMLIAFTLYIIAGFLDLQYWSVFTHPIPNGALELFKAAALLSFAARGGQVVAELGDELKNPGRTIPIACLGGTMFAGLLYVLLAMPATGVLPLPEVAGKPMSVVAEHVLNPAGFTFFVIGGSFVALISSLNSNMLWGTKALLASIEDGWFPTKLGAVNRRFGTPHWLLTIMFVIGIAPILMNIDMANIANAASALQQINAVIILIASIRLRKIFPQAHANSPFKIGYRTHWALLVAGIAISIWQFMLLTSDLTTAVIISAMTWIALGTVWALIRYRRIGASAAPDQHPTRTAEITTLA
jgi:APA family basic amino acid/polyamine antiporter